MTTLDRRTLLIAIAAGLSTGSLGLLACRRANPSLFAAPARELAAYADHLTALGQAFLESHPHETLETLSNWLVNTLDWQESVTPELLAQKLSSQVQRDFEEWNIARVAGWALSITEARWCALVALSAHVIETP